MPPSRRAVRTTRALYAQRLHSARIHQRIRTWDSTRAVYAALRPRVRDAGPRTQRIRHLRPRRQAHARTTSRSSSVLTPHVSGLVPVLIYHNSMISDRLCMSQRPSVPYATTPLRRQPPAFVHCRVHRLAFHRGLCLYYTTHSIIMSAGSRGVKYREANEVRIYQAFPSFQRGSITVEVRKPETFEHSDA